MADDWKSYVDLDGTHVLAPANAPTTVDGLMERMGLHEAQILRNAAGTEVYSVTELLATAWQMADFGARSELVPRITELQTDLEEARAQRNEAMVNGARHRENHGICDEAVKKLTAERDDARARLRARELYGPRDND